MDITKPLSAFAVTEDRVSCAASRLYDAECALHNAHQSHVDAWVEAASARLHIAITEYLATLAAMSEMVQPCRSGNAARVDRRRRASRSQMTDVTITRP